MIVRIRGGELLAKPFGLSPQRSDAPESLGTMYERAWRSREMRIAPRPELVRDSVIAQNWQLGEAIAQELVKRGLTMPG
jgi:hypothetical protein